MSTAVEIDDLVVARGRRVVLDGLSTRIERGQVTGLLGPSGSGKTTLIRAIVGVQKVRSGSVTVLGEPAGSPRNRGRTGYMTQAPSVYADLSVLENARYFATLYDLDAAAATDAIAAVGLTDYADQLVADLSGGQRSRASLAAAVVGRPQLLVLDEPTVGLDPLLREELWRYFAALAESGTIVLVSSHVMDEANRCDRLLLLRDGAVVADATPDDIKRHAGTDDMDEAFLRIIREREAV